VQTDFTYAAADTPEEEAPQAASAITDAHSATD
jgi:hypothetical protein